MSPGARVGARHCSTPASAGAGAGLEDGAVHRSIDDKGCAQAVLPQPGDKGGDLPMAVRDRRDQARPALLAAAPSGHLGGGPGLVDKDEPGGIKPALVLPPLVPRGGDVRARLLGGVRGFF